MYCISLESGPEKRYDDAIMIKPRYSRIRRADKSGEAESRWQTQKIFISLQFFDIDRKFHFFGDIPITSRILYMTSRFCKKRLGDARNVRIVRRLRNFFHHFRTIILYLFVRAFHPLADDCFAALAIKRHHLAT